MLASSEYILPGSGRATYGDVWEGDVWEGDVWEGDAPAEPNPSVPEQWILLRQPEEAWREPRPPVGITLGRRSAGASGQNRHLMGDTLNGNAWEGDAWEGNVWEGNVWEGNVWEGDAPAEPNPSVPEQWIFLRQPEEARREPRPPVGVTLGRRSAGASGQNRHLMGDTLNGNAW